jgi:hypothetical protein
MGFASGRKLLGSVFETRALSTVLRSILSPEETNAWRDRAFDSGRRPMRPAFDLAAGVCDRLLILAEDLRDRLLIWQQAYEIGF